MEAVTVYRTSARRLSIAPPPKRPPNSAAMALCVVLVILGLVCAFIGLVRGAMAIAGCIAAITLSVEELSQ